MLVEFLIVKYQNLLKDIFIKYIKLTSKNNLYSKLSKLVDIEIKDTINAFNALVDERKDVCKDFFENGCESALYTIDKELFDCIKAIFEKVSILLGLK